MDEKKVHIFGEYTLDTTRGCLLCGEETVHLRPQAYRALHFLMENRGRLISKDELVKEVWEGRAVTDDSLVKCLKDVRIALGADADQYLRNERGRGYIFEHARNQPTSVWTEDLDFVRVVIEEEEIVPETALDSGLSSAMSTAALASGTELALKKNQHEATARKPYRRNAMFAIAFVVLAAGLAVAYFKYFRSEAHALTSIAVLPFVNEGSNPEMQYLSDGLSESIINSLSQVPRLKVIARSSSFEYKGKDVSPQTAAKDLNVEAILTGRVLQRGDNLVVSVELMDARDNTQIWGERYDSRAGDLESVQLAIARTVSEKLRMRLSGAQEQLVRRATENSQAYQFYLNGLFSYRQGSLDQSRRALDYFNQAVALDPNFALAWAALAKTHLAFAGNSWADPKEANVKAKAAAQAALRLDETLPEAHAALARIQHHEWNWEEAEREYKRAIELNPSLVEAHTYYSDYLSVMGRHAEALAEVKRARDVDPLRVGLRVTEAMVLYKWRRYAEALEVMLQTRKLSPRIGAPAMAFIYEANGMYEEAIEEHRKAIGTYGRTTGILCYLGWALARAGRTEEARVILEELNSSKEYVSPAEFAALHALLGDKERAFALLEEAYAAHDLQLQYLNLSPHYDSLRQDQRFQDLLRRVGLTS